VPQQRGLADARLPADHENGAVTGTRMGEHGVEAFALTASGQRNQARGWQASRDNSKGLPPRP
jgi:hypothetical protein